MWPSEQKLESLYRSSSSQVFYKFKSEAGAGFLNYQNETLRPDGSEFTLSDDGFLMLSGGFLNVVGNNKSDAHFETSSTPDVKWDEDNHMLISMKKKLALDIYEVGSRNVKLWTFNGGENQRWIKQASEFPAPLLPSPATEISL